MDPTTRIYLAFADEDTAIRDDLRRCIKPYLKSDIYDIWDRADALAGENVSDRMRRALAASTMAVVLLSSDFLASDICIEELDLINVARCSRSLRVIPVLARACDFKRSVLADLEALPKDKVPVASAKDRDLCLLGIAQAIVAATGLNDSEIPLRSGPARVDLEDAYRRRETLMGLNEPTTEVDAQIRSFRRQLRTPSRRLPGDRLDGRYALIRVIGEGGFATVWRARDMQQNRDVAVKVLHDIHAADLTRRERFLRGARKMRELSHPAIASILEASPEGSKSTYLVMDPFDGDLRSLAASGIVRPELTFRIVLRIADALAYMHEREIVHRDVKPANILVRGANEPFLADFDLIGFKDTTGGTRTGALGTFVYAAPEMMTRPQEAGPAADVFGLAMTTIFLLYGAMLPVDVLRSGPSFIDGLEVAPAIKTVLKRAIDWNPERRPQDGRAFSSALTEAVERRNRTAGTIPQKEKHFLLWSAGEQIPSETRWVCVAQNSKPRLFGKRRGLIIAAAGRLWEWQSSLRPMLLVDSAAVEQNDAVAPGHPLPPTIPRLHASIPEGHLVDLLSGLRVPAMSDRPIPFEDTQQFELQRSVIPIGVVGNRVFVFEWNLEHNRGFWHYRASAFFRVLDLEKLEMVEPLDDDARATIRNELEPSALARLEDIMMYESSSSEVDEALRPRLTIYRPRWGADGHMGLSCQITATCAFTESDNRWDSYTKSVSMILPRAPTSFPGAMSVPTDILKMWPGAAVDDAYTGVSHIDDEELLLSLESAFDGDIG